MRPVIFFDLDGVLADFVGGACHAHGRPVPRPCPWDFFAGWGLPSPDEFWAPLANRDFWAYLDVLPDGDALYAAVRKGLAASDSAATVGVLSSGLCPGSTDGKLDWLRGNYPSLAGAAVFTPHKELCASPTKLLIDDHEPNVERFRAAGGAAVLVPRSWNSRAGECQPGGEFDPEPIAREVAGWLARC